MIKTKELKKIDPKELESKLEQLRKDLIKYNAQISTGTPPENPGQVKSTKKTIARILTILKNKQEVLQKK